MNSFFKCLILIVITLFSWVLIGHFYYRATGDFDPSYLLEAKEAAVGSELQAPEDIEKLLAQPFHYLGQGHQTFAFASADGEFVLKLFKQDYLKRSGWQNVFPPVPPFRSFLLHTGKSKEARREKLLNGYQMAYLHDRQNSGLLYYHPTVTVDPHLKVSLVTGLGFHKTLDLNRDVFALQVRAETTKNELSSLLSKGKVNEAKGRLKELFALYFSSYRNGIFDHDHNLLDNTGFTKSYAIRQDVGKIVYDPRMIDKSFVSSDLKKIQEERLAPWFRKRFPKSADVMIQAMQEEVEKGLSEFPSGSHSN